MAALVAPVVDLAVTVATVVKAVGAEEEGMAVVGWD